ncbi:MAG: transketolase C-terminal domain-containing protein [Oligoflexia bacterium]|nr:transketolase C-terminal domain-containing protein [Oligoflexia bacterium]
MAGKATRASFGESLAELGQEFKNVVVLDADLSKSTKSESFAKKFPERFFQMGISEMNMIGVAAGLAFSGKVPFLCSFGCFLTGRFDTIRLSVGYSNANVRLVGTHAGIGIGEDGYSQMALEDIGCMRTLPGMAVLQPADDIETKQMMQFLMKHQGPVYLRLTRQNLEPVNGADYKFQFGRGVELKSGKDAVVFATGGLTAHALNAAKQLEKEGMSVGVVNIHTIKPLDVELVQKLSKQVKHVFTAEDHNIIGGLGSAVCETLSSAGIGTRVTRLGVQDVYGESGSPEGLYEKHGLDAQGLARSIKSNINAN